MDGNPYAAPRMEGENGEYQVACPRRMVVAWERLRLKYNGILLIAGVLVLVVYAVQGMPIVIGIFGAIFVAIGANACFFLGPMAEFYACAIQDIEESPTLRRYLFIVGTIFSLGVFGLALLPPLFAFV